MNDLVLRNTQLNCFDALSIWNDLNSFAGDEAPSLRIIQRWCKSFKVGRQEIEDLARLCRPIVETLPPNIDLISNAIEQDPYITDKILKSLRFLADFQFWRLKEPKRQFLEF